MKDCQGKKREEKTTKRDSNGKGTQTKKAKNPTKTTTKRRCKALPHENLNLQCQLCLRPFGGLPRTEPRDEKNEKVQKMAVQDQPLNSRSTNNNSVLKNSPVLSNRNGTDGKQTNQNNTKFDGWTYMWSIFRPYRTPGQTRRFPQHAVGAEQGRRHAKP